MNIEYATVTQYTSLTRALQSPYANIEKEQKKTRIHRSHGVDRVPPVGLYIL